MPHNRVAGGLSPPAPAPRMRVRTVSLTEEFTDGLVEELLAGGYPGETSVVLAYRVGWPDELIVATKISDLSKTVRDVHIKQQAIFLVLPGQNDDPVFSKLYSSEFSHGCRAVL